MLCTTQPSCGELVAHPQEAMPFVSERWRSPADGGEMKQMLFELCISKQAKGGYGFSSPVLCGR